MNLLLTFLTKNWERLELERFGAPSRLSCVMATPRFRASSHTIFFVLAADQSAPILVAKVPRLPGDTTRLDREAANLRAVQSSRPGGFDSIPRIIAYEDYGDSRLLLETALHGQPMKPALARQQTEFCIDAATKWLRDLYIAAANRGTNGVWFERLVERPLNQLKSLLPLAAEEERLIEQTLELAGSLRDKEMSLVFEHGDFSPPNILLSEKNKLSVVDWELAESSGLPVTDLFFFLTYVAFARRGAQKNAEHLAAFHEAFFGPSPWAWPHVIRYCDHLQLPDEMLKPLFVLCWSRYVAGLVTRLHDGEASGKKLDHATLEWLRTNRYYALWRHTVEHVTQPARLEKELKKQNGQLNGKIAMIKTNKKIPTVLVTDAGRGSAIAIIRSLGQKGYRVIAADSDPKNLGFRSRYVDERLLYPAPENAPREFCAAIAAAAKAKGVDLIIPATDLAIQPLAANRRAFEGVVKLALPDDAQLQIVTDKVKTVQLAKRVGVPVPETCVVDTVDEAVAKAESLSWPVVLKPQSSRRLHESEKIESFKVTYAADLTELKAAMSRFDGRCSVLLQSYCEGTGYGVELLMHDGQPLAAFQHQRRREIPLTGGASAYRESVALDDELYGYSVRLLQELRWTGLAMVEFKVSESGAKLMEINGRVWGSLPLAVASGVDFPAMLAELYLHGAEAIKPQLDSNYKLGLRCRDLQRDLMWIAAVLLQRRHYDFLAMPSRKRALLALLGLFNPQRKFDLLTLKDPMPGVAELPHIFAKFRSKMQEAE